MNYRETKVELTHVLEECCNNAGLTDILEGFRKQKIVIYGAGYCGRFVLRVLKNNGITPVYFLDANAKKGDKVEGICVYPPDKTILDAEEKNEIAVLLCVISGNEIRDEITKNIKELGYKKVLLCQDIYFSFSGIFDAASPVLDYGFYKEKESKIINCVDLFSDSLSIKTYKNNISAYLMRKFGKTQPVFEEPQYFPSDIPLSKGYSRFVDCGAFDGDTIRQLLSIKGRPEAVYAFEPDLTNFAKLTGCVGDEGLKHSVLYPCGVSGKTEILRFNMKNNTQSSIAEDGDSIIQCVALDDVLKNVAPTFIKMDIEGAEYDALLGASNIIAKYTPDLAISVYHNFNHYFEIPLLIDNWDLGYRFWLRTYDRCATETIMYATCER